MSCAEDSGEGEFSELFSFFKCMVGEGDTMSKR